MKVLSLLTASFFVLLLTACNKEPPPVPPRPDPCPWPEVTTQGLNTFGCKINGKEWVPCVDMYAVWSNLRPLDCRVTESDGSNALSLSLIRSIQDTTFSDTNSDMLISMGLWPLMEGIQNVPVDFDYAAIDVFSFEEPHIRYEIIDTTSNNFFNIIRLDTSKNIISGTFQITVIDEASGKKIELTEGRFDITYYQQ